MGSRYARIYFYMRLLNLFIVLNLTLCLTGIYSVTDLYADESAGSSSHCRDQEQGDAQESLQHDSIDFEINAEQVECYNCCLDVLPSPSDNGNLNASPTVIALLPFLSSENNSGYIQVLKPLFTKRPHGPPDIYLLHSSYLL